MKSFNSTDHVGPQPVVKGKVWEDIIPPTMVCSCFVLPLLTNPMEGILGNLENSPQCFFKQKQRGELPRASSGNVPTQMPGYEPYCQNAWSSQEANPWLAQWSANSCPLQRALVKADIIVYVTPTLQLSVNFIWWVGAYSGYRPVLV